MKPQPNIYADYSATTPVRQEVLDAMTEVLKNDFGNPSSIHRFGKEAKRQLESARDKIASLINAKPEQIIFTSGGTESNNSVILGTARFYEKSKLTNKKKHIITTKIEHPSVKEPIEYLEAQGWEVTWLNINKEGFIDLEELKNNITSQTMLVSIIHASNEIGTVQDLKAISKICHEKQALLHIDGIQSYGKIPIDVNDLKIDFLSMSAHKIYGPKGVGALYVRSQEGFEALQFGGGQESKIRPGTENLAGIVGFGVAAHCIKAEMLANAKTLRKFQIKLMEDFSKIENVILTGASLDKVKENLREEKYLYRIPGHISLCCRKIEGESLVLQSDLRGIAMSSGSACKNNSGDETGKIGPSHVLLASNVPQDFLKGSIRITLGKHNTESDVDYIGETVKNIVRTLSKDLVLS